MERESQAASLAAGGRRHGRRENNPDGRADFRSVEKVLIIWVAPFVLMKDSLGRRKPPAGAAGFAAAKTCDVPPRDIDLPAPAFKDLAAAE
jgi:hypothetical protein